MSAYRELSFEDLSPEDFMRLGGYELAQALLEVGAEIIAIGRLAVKARLHLTEKRKALIILADTDKRAAKCSVLDAQTTLDTIRDRAKTLRDLKSVLQTALRAIPS